MILRQASRNCPESALPATGPASAPSAPTAPARVPGEIALPPDASHPTHLLLLVRGRSPARSVPARHTTCSLAGAIAQAPLRCSLPANAASTTARTDGESDTIPGAHQGE